LGQGNLPRVEEIGIDWRVLAFAAALSTVCAARWWWR